MNTLIKQYKLSLRDNYKALPLLGILLVVVQLSYGQQTRTISGIVYDMDAQPLVGATVMQQGTTHGTTANFEGEFSIQVPVGSVLEISYIGFIPTLIK